MTSSFEAQGPNQGLQPYIAPGTLEPTKALQLSPLALAYIGDAVYELRVRSAFLLPPSRLQTYHRQVVAQVCALGQTQQLQRLLPHLSALELEVVRKGRNAAGKGSRQAPSDDYRQATGLEALMGYLYLTDPQRLDHLWDYLDLANSTVL